MTDFHLDPPDDEHDPVSEMFDFLTADCDELIGAARAHRKYGALEALIYEIAECVVRRQQRDEGEDRAADRKDRLEEYA